jgi:hypothetical protein
VKIGWYDAEHRFQQKPAWAGNSVYSPHRRVGCLHDLIARTIGRHACRIDLNPAVVIKSNSSKAAPPSNLLTKLAERQTNPHSTPQKSYPMLPPRLSQPTEEKLWNCAAELPIKFDANCPIRERSQLTGSFISMLV